MGLGFAVRKKICGVQKEEKLLDEITLRCTCRGCGCQACGGLYWVSLREALHWQMVTEAEARKMMKEGTGTRP